MGSSEELIWMGKPSQISNMGLYGLCFLSSWMIFPVFIAAWRYWITDTTEYKISSQRVFIKTGIFNKKIDEVELYRIKDYTLLKPWFYRLFNLSNLVMVTSDSTVSKLNFYAIPSGDMVRNQVRIKVEQLRTDKNIREVDFN